MESEKDKPTYVVTSFRANTENWKKLKVLSMIDGIPIQEKLNKVIESHLKSNYDKALGGLQRTNGQSEDH